MRVFGLERWQVEKTGDAVHILQMCFARVSRQAHRNDRYAGEDGILLPRPKRHRGEQIVVADNGVRIMNSDQLRRATDANAWDRLDPHSVEKATEVFAQVRMSTDAQNAHVFNIRCVERDDQRSNVAQFE
jgi:hypothetical protein